MTTPKATQRHLFPLTASTLRSFSRSLGRALDEASIPLPATSITLDSLTIAAAVRTAVQAIGPGRRVKTRNAQGRPERGVYAFRIVNADPQHLDAWDDGECFTLDALGWSVEVHHEARPV